MEEKIAPGDYVLILKPFCNIDKIDNSYPCGLLRSCSGWVGMVSHLNAQGMPVIWVHADGDTCLLTRKNVRKLTDDEVERARNVLSFLALSGKECRGWRHGEKDTGDS